MLKSRTVISFILISILILSFSTVTYGFNENKEGQGESITINKKIDLESLKNTPGIDLKGGQYTLKVPSKENVKSSSGVTANAVVIGGNGTGIPISDWEYSEAEISYPYWFWDNDIDARGISGQYVLASNPAYQSQIPALRMQIKNTVWLNSHYYTGSASYDLMCTQVEVNSPWAHDRQKGDSVEVFGYHKMYDTYGYQFVNRTTDSYSTIR